MPDTLSLTLKDPSVKIDDLTPEMARGLLTIFSVLRSRGIPFVITSGNDGKHGARSLHYENRAIDFRLPSRFTGNPCTDASVKLALAGRLGSDFDVVLEDTHFHVEYDPKGAT